MSTCNQIEIDNDDPFAAVEADLRRKDQEKQATDMIGRALARLVMGPRKEGGRPTRGDSAFFAMVAMQLQRVVDWQCETAWTDGQKLGYNPAFVCSLPTPQVLGVVMHEVLHVSQKHPTRRGGRTPKRFNTACDVAINPMIRDMGAELPAGALFPDRAPYNFPVGLCAEEYYNLLPEDAGDGGEPGTGEVKDPKGQDGSTGPAVNKDVEGQIDRMVAQAAAAAQGRGGLSGSMRGLVDETLNPVVDWREVLSEFVRKTARNDYSFSQPNRRFISQGLYLPSLRSDEIGQIVVSLDTSGSIDNATLETFVAELQGIVSPYPCKLTLLYHHSHVYHVQEWTPADGTLALAPIETGGTSHEPVFAKIAELDLAPVCYIGLTDLLTVFPSEPDFPVLWVSAGMGHSTRAPWGQVAEVKR